MSVRLSVYASIHTLASVDMDEIWSPGGRRGGLLNIIIVNIITIKTMYIFHVNYNNYTSSGSVAIVNFQRNSCNTSSHSFRMFIFLIVQRKKKNIPSEQILLRKSQHPQEVFKSRIITNHRREFGIEFLFQLNDCKSIRYFNKHCKYLQFS